MPQLQTARPHPGTHSDPSNERDLSYGLAYRGFIYASKRISSGMTVRPAAVLLISADYEPFELQLKSGQLIRATAAVVPPRVERSLEARGVALLSLNILPSHEAYYTFGSLRHAGVLPMERLAFAAFDEGFTALSNGTASIALAEEVFAGAVNAAHRQTPPTSPPDPLTLALIRLLDAEPDLSADELAHRCGRSRQMISRQFSADIGVPLRDYLLWLKQRHLFDLLHTKTLLTDVAHRLGFSDSPGFSRAFQRWYGQSPSASRSAKFIGPSSPPGAHKAN
jgi:AraC family transcriptional regulator, arabinose operon regulatory protein